MKKRHHTPEQVIRKLAEGDKLLNQGAELAKGKSTFIEWP